MRTPQQDRSAASADRMLEAALALLEGGGLAAVTVAAVAREAGASNGSLYHRFHDRTGLLLAAQGRILDDLSTAVADAFAEADAEPDDLRAVQHLASTAIGMFEIHRGSLRALFVEAQGDPAFEPRNDVFAHRLSATVGDWLVARLGADPAAAQAAYRIILALGVSRALFDDARVSPVPITLAALADALATAVLAVATPPRR